ncbi:MAG: cytochrome c-type biogenesis protein CcmH [Gammaproteobacteria bacterium]|nr:cytochrome c-type biogenesis protein CcmH [Gammaproteobacteria bacterium]MBQ0838988.1 cytochrome c-type biogenesis protein CcmH [Gammaproteobacteria bacterium]
MSALLLVLCFPAWGVIEVDRLSTPELSERYQQLVAEYRCPKCQNQNLAESNSPISIDLRTEIRRLLEEGASDTQISDYLVARYGEFVLYRPRVQASTYLLWLTPAVLLVLGLLVVVFIVQRQKRGASAAPTALSGSEQETLQALLEETQSQQDKTANPEKVESS